MVLVDFCVHLRLIANTFTALTKTQKKLMTFLFNFFQILIK